MVNLPPQVLDLVKRPDTCKVLTTINDDGSPHSIVCGAFLVPDTHTIVVGQTWMNITGANLERDPRAEIVVWIGAAAYTIQCRFVKRSEDEKYLKCMNEKLERMNLKVFAVWFFEVVSVRDEGRGPTVGTPIA